MYSDGIAPLVDAEPDPGGVGFTAGAAVAVVDDGGQKALRRCGALLDTGHPNNLYGFLYVDGQAGEKVLVITSRGSQVTPLVEGGGPLTPNQPVFLSTVPGMVVQPAPLGAGRRIIRVGQAISATEMTLVTDQFFDIPAG